ncbi:hypothetical protein FGG08_003391 [Glutinoglossum americanum]|uniref:Mitochondrial genome maintenance protein MGM101 n=1 Tax=Glutinoglossum americanum TaxID=1670608 RepID=A0A9P8L4S6_9PEZI|nr:hypothetical protein FGG08_003391 [Glutinoglossum americanum]
MASQLARTTGKGPLLPVCLSFRAAPLPPHAATVSRRAVTKRFRSYQCLALNPTSRLQAQQVLKPSSPRKAEDSPTTITAPIPNGDSPGNPSDLPIRDLTGGFADQNIVLDEGSRQVDWTNSFHGLSAEPFPKEIAEILTQSIPEEDVEVKPDGIIYLPEIKYRRILNRAFGPGGWGLAPRGETIVTSKAVTREYALVVLGRLMSVARGEQDYFSPDGIPTAAEGCKSNAMVRCCKDLGVASELWDPRWIRKYLEKNTREAMVENVLTKRRKKFVLRKDDKIRYPFKEIKTVGASPQTTK